jgi:Cof subfamily protein (haloacid dehalogenase superfamily)
LKRFDGWVLFSDVDGTLINAAHEIVGKNLDAAKDFIEKGGRFALATGRGISSAQWIAEQTGVNMPSILLGGTLVYDFSEQKIIRSVHLPDCAREILYTVLRDRPEIRASVWGPQGRFEVGAKEGAPPDSVRRDAHTLPGPWNKLVFFVPAQERLDFMRWLEDMNVRDTFITSSSVNFVEVLPAGCSKGSALTWMIEYYRLDRDRVAVVGDYFNDYEMLSLPGIRSFCPENAPEQIKTLCEHVLPHVDQGAVAALIGML